jgi:hypothetical protein
MFDQIGQIISFLTAGAAIIYILGGFIVNLYLTQYGIVEYQVLQIKFLAVGLMFLAVDLFINLFSYFIALLIGISITTSAEASREILLNLLICIPSLIFASQLFFAAIRKRQFNAKRQNEWFYILWAGLLANIPTGFLLSHLFLEQNIPVQGQTLLNIIVCVALAQAALVLYYARWIYGSSIGNSGLMLIGRGAPVQIEIAGDADQIGLLKELGVPVRKKGITEPVYLIDETDTQYIIGIQKEDKLQPIKVMKKFVTAMLYHIEENNKDNDG